MFIFCHYNNMFWIKVSKSIFYIILKKETPHWRSLCYSPHKHWYRCLVSVLSSAGSAPSASLTLYLTPHIGDPLDSYLEPSMRPKLLRLSLNCIVAANISSVAVLYAPHELACVRRQWRLWLRISVHNYYLEIHESKNTPKFDKHFMCDYHFCTWRWWAFRLYFSWMRYTQVPVPCNNCKCLGVQDGNIPCTAYFLTCMKLIPLIHFSMFFPVYIKLLVHTSKAHT